MAMTCCLYTNYFHLCAPWLYNCAWVETHNNCPLLEVNSEWKYSPNLFALRLWTIFRMKMFFCHGLLLLFSRLLFPACIYGSTVSTLEVESIKLFASDLAACSPAGAGQMHNAEFFFPRLDKTQVGLSFVSTFGTRYCYVIADYAICIIKWELQPTQIWSWFFSQGFANLI